MTSGASPSLLFAHHKGMSLGLSLGNAGIVLIRDEEELAFMKEIFPASDEP